MNLRSTFLFAFLLLGLNALQAQTAKDATLPITATLLTGPTRIMLTWPNPGADSMLMLRRTKGQSGMVWQLVFNLYNSNLTSVTDNGVAAGQTYEYVIQRAKNGVFSFGYAHVAVNATPINSRGKVLIFVDSTTADALGVELVRLKNDLRGDGWWPIPFHTGPSSTVQSIKNQIVTSYNADPLNVKAVLLLGSIPIPYSGSYTLADNTIWDGHPEHGGAWPSDAFYADVNGVWTDVTANITDPARPANDNIPGDGKFDQSFIPSSVELQIGRVDFRRLTAQAYGVADHIGLMKRYLDKNHRWRIGDYPVENKALVDDNFGYFGGEAFAANGFRNAYPLVGESNIMTGVGADFFDDTNPQSYLLGYGCGSGNYQGAGGIGSSANFATDSVNIVFSNLFGSYFGDWDFEADPFMPAALASRGGILTCSWAGRPHWFNHALASGETIGYCNKETMDTQFNFGFPGYNGRSGAHVALLGDPTLRAHVVKPATNLTATAAGCNSVMLNWTASAESVAGYHVYRALSQDGSYTRLTTNPVVGTSYTDNAPLLDTLYYQVRAIKNVSTPGGGTYANNAIGPIKSIVFIGAGPTLTTTGGTLNCAVFNVMLTATPSAPVVNWVWFGPGINPGNQFLQNPTVMNAGTYTVTATDATGCSSTATATVLGDYSPPFILAIASNEITCANASAVITVDSTDLSSCIISGPGGFFVQGFSAVVTQAATYTISATSAINGCFGNTFVSVIADMAIPGATASNAGSITCVNPTSQLTASSNMGGVTFAWTGPCLVGSTAACAGIYIVTVTNAANGCTNTASTTVVQDIVPPTANAGPDLLINCNNPTVVLNATGVPANSIVQWSGPCIEPGIPPMASCGGVYTVVVTNTINGCSDSDTVSVLEDFLVPPIVLPPPFTITCDELCYPFTAPNTPNIEIYIGGQLVPAGTTVLLCQPGTYSILVKSTLNGCFDVAEFVITQDAGVPIANAGPDKTLSCNNSTVQLDGSGSSVGALISILWTGPGGFISPQLNPIVSQEGTYTLEVVNTSNGCSATDIVVVTKAPDLVVTGNPVAITCDGIITTCVNVSGGTPPYNILWSNGLSGNCTTYTGTSTIGVTVTDAGGCSFENMQTVVVPPILTLQFQSTVSCDGFSIVCASASGGTPPYTYKWSGGSSTPCITFINGGTFAVTVTDAAGCEKSNNVVVNIPPAITVSFTVVNESAPNANDGSVDLTATGGTGVLQYDWSNLPGVNNPQDQSGLAGGIYTVTVTDANGCTKTISATVTTISGTEETEIFQQFQLSPNPTRGLATLSLKLYEATALRVEIRDVAGRLIWESPTLQTDVLNLPIDMSHSPAGMYSISVWVGNHVFVRKLAVAR